MNDDTAASAAIIRRLRDAPFYAKSRTAHAVLRELSDAQLAALALPAKTELLETIFNRVFLFPSKPQLVRLMNSFGLEPLMTEWRRTTIDGIARFVASDPETMRARDNWKTLNDRQKLRALRRIANHHDSLGGFGGGDITTFREAEQSWGDKGRIQLGWYRRADSLIAVNLHADALGDNFDFVVGVLLHENTHCHQHQLAELWQRGRLSPDAPEAALARVFAANIKHSRELLGTASHEIYEAQPIEQHARGIGFGVTRALKQLRVDAALKREFGQPPKPPAPPQAPPRP